MIVWLASYPKSGNTWVRSIISSLLYTEDGIFDFTLLSKIPKFPNKSYFKHFTNDFGDFDQIKKYWIPAQEKLNSDKQMRFLKTHHLNCKIDQYYFTNKQNTLATIYIVRDPRNLVTSISNHYSKTISDAKTFLLEPRFIAGSVKNQDLEKDPIKTLIGTWSEHYKFWKNDNKDYLLIKYEDLLMNTESELKRIIFFLEKFMPIKTNYSKNKNIIESTKFENLQSMENKGQFMENAQLTPSLKKQFFYLGPENKWENTLEKNIKEEIENHLSEEMSELGYL